MEKYKLLLDQKLKDTVSKIKELKKVEAEYYSDEADQSQGMEKEEMRQKMLMRQTSTMYSIMAALDRYNRGEYGECMECGCEVSNKRLAAFPMALYCVDCQEDNERL